MVLTPRSEAVCRQPLPVHSFGRQSQRWDRHHAIHVPVFVFVATTAVVHGQLGFGVACLTQPQLHPLSQRWLGFLQDVLKNDLRVLPSVLPAQDVFRDRSLLSEDVYPFSGLQNRGDFFWHKGSCANHGMLGVGECYPCGDGIHAKPGLWIALPCTQNPQSECFSLSCVSHMILFAAAL